MIDSARVGDAAAANNGCVGSLDGHDGLQHSLHHAAQSSNLEGLDMSQAPKPTDALVIKFAHRTMSSS
jgi:hypothetical protein